MPYLEITNVLLPNFLNFNLNLLIYKNAYIFTKKIKLHKKYKYILKYCVHQYINIYYNPPSLKRTCWV